MTDAPIQLFVLIASGAIVRVWMPRDEAETALVHHPEAFSTSLRQSSFSTRPWPPEGRLSPITFTDLSTSSPGV
jgi:hypothetical protein